MNTLKYFSKFLSLDKPVIMGILNVTPDSFYDGGKYQVEKTMLKHVEKMISDGASIIDIGAVSTRPGAPVVDEQEELSRLMPTLRTIRKTFADTLISVDTFRSMIAKKVAEEGADIINDISGGSFDANMFDTIARLKMPYVMMHIQGTPQNMQDAPYYENVVKEIFDFFKRNIKKLELLGHTAGIILDPGFGFGKILEHNFEILNNLSFFKKLNFPLLISVSRKSMINKVLKILPKDALTGTIALNTIALLNGADILRVHDVKEAFQIISLVEKYKLCGNS